MSLSVVCLLRKLIFILTPISILLVTIFISNPQSASAAASYGVSVQSACQDQYPDKGAMAGYWNTADPYGWFCWRITGGSVGFPASTNFNWEVLGGVNLNAWCSRHHPGTYAVMVYHAAFGWRCWSK